MMPRVRLHFLLVVVLALGTMLVLTTFSLRSSNSITSGSSHPFKFEPYRWPFKVKANPIVVNEGVPPLAIDTELTAAEITTAKPPNYPFASSFVGSDGYALGYINHNEYPIHSSNGGSTWYIAGSCFVQAGTLYGDFGANVIKTFNQSVVAAFGYQAIYTTNDGGRLWHTTDFVSVIDGANTKLLNEDFATPIYAYSGVTYDTTTGELGVALTQFAWNPVGGASTRVLASARYESDDGGLIWHHA